MPPSLFGIEEGRIDGSPVMEAIITRVHDRQEKWRTVVVPELPDPPLLSEDAILGSFSYCLQQSRMRLLKSSCLLAVDGTSETPPALARDYLTLRHKHAAPIRAVQRERLLAGMRPLPCYSQPASSDEGCYLDIAAAYWQIMRAVGWQVDYNPGRWLMRGPGVRDFPWRGETANEKLARNALVSSAHSAKIPRWQCGPQAIVEVACANRLINDQLTRLVRDVLHAIANDMRRLRVPYIATDGYILTSPRMLRQARDVLDSWGLYYRIKAHGRTEIRGPGAYTVGTFRTRVTSRQTEPTSNIEAGEYDRWLRPRFEALCAASGIPD